MSTTKPTPAEIESLRDRYEDILHNIEAVPRSIITLAQQLQKKEIVPIFGDDTHVQALRYIEYVKQQTELKTVLENHQKTYRVTFDIRGTVDVEVKAFSETEARQKAEAQIDVSDMDDYDAEIDDVEVVQ